jgi:hypothetical protein
VLGTAIDGRQQRGAEIAARLSADTRVLAQRSDLEAQRGQLSAALGELQLQADRATTVARFIRVTAQIAALHRVSLERIDGGIAAPSPIVTPAAGAARAAPPALEPLPLDVTLRGSYADLIASIRDLARAPVTVRVVIAALERTSPDGAAAPPALTARLHVALLRLANPNFGARSMFPSAEDTAIHARSL